MTQNIITYPSPLSVKYATDVRIFDEALFALIDDLKDTINENNLDGLAAFQIGNYYNVIVIRDENNQLIEMINPRLIAHQGRVMTRESTVYYPNMYAEIERFASISVIYQDKNGKDCSLRINGAMAIVVQRKIDYTFGATFILKMSLQERERFEKQLSQGAYVGYDDYCPTTFTRDYILQAINGILLVMLLGAIGSFFVQEKLWAYELYASFGVFTLTIIYFFYGYYEGKKYTTCTSCQVGNIIGTCAINLIKLTLIMVGSYLIMH